MYIKVSLLFVRDRDGQQSGAQRQHGPVRPGFWGRQEHEDCGVSALRVQGAVPGDGCVCREGGMVSDIRPWLTALRPDYVSLGVFKPSVLRLYHRVIKRIVFVLHPLIQGALRDNKTSVQCKYVHLLKGTVHPKNKKYTFFLLPVVLFISWGCFSVSCLVLEISGVEIFAFS